MDMHLTTDRYLQGRLTVEEEAAFEERLTWDRELLEELELAERLRDGMKATVTENDIVFTHRPNAWGSVAALLENPRYAAAASFLIAVTMAASLFMSLGRFEGGATATSVVPLLQTRGPDSFSEVPVEPHKTTVLLLNADRDYESYRLTVRSSSSDGPIVWESESVTVTYPDSLAISFPPGQLRDGDYFISVDGIALSNSPSERFQHLQDFRFRAVLAAP